MFSFFIKIVYTTTTTTGTKDIHCFWDVKEGLWGGFNRTRVRTETRTGSALLGTPPGRPRPRYLAPSFVGRLPQPNRSRADEPCAQRLHFRLYQGPGSYSGATRRPGVHVEVGWRFPERGRPLHVSFRCTFVVVKRNEITETYYDTITQPVR